jgi:hypothetical protein
VKKVLLLGIAVLIGSAGANAQSMTSLSFVTHAAFFSTETGLPAALDPQVFVLALKAPAARGPQNIDHVAGIRNARISDDHLLPIYDAHSERVEVELADLAPGAQFSLFENHFDQSPIGFTPLDGAGHSNSFRANADGTASVVIVSPTSLTHANAVLLVYHSDGKTHGEERGEIGVDAHHQLIARLP